MCATLVYMCCKQVCKRQKIFYVAAETGAAVPMEIDDQWQWALLRREMAVFASTTAYDALQ